MLSSLAWHFTFLIGIANVVNNRLESFFASQLNAEVKWIAPLIVLISLYYIGSRESVKDAANQDTGHQNHDLP